MSAMMQPATPIMDDEDEKLRMAFMGVLDAKQREADRRVERRAGRETTWMENLRQKQGLYSDDMVKRLKEANQSAIFINQTRPKCNAMIARLMDLLFPTDDKNWGIEPTPVPKLARAGKEAVRIALAAAEAADAQIAAALEAGDQGRAQGIQEEVDRLKLKARKFEAEQAEARKRATAMQDEIEDQLQESRYAEHCRQVITDAVDLGAGIIKGPVIGEKSRRAWTMDTASGAYVMSNDMDTRPSFIRVDPWSFFPDETASTPGEGMGTFERHLMTKSELRRFARQRDVDQNAVRRLIRDTPRMTLPTYFTQLQTLSQSTGAAIEDRYTVWEYRGPLDFQDLETVALLTNREQIIEDASNGEIMDPLDEVQVCMFFCDGELLKFGLHPLDTGDCMYSVFRIEPDPIGPWGSGMPEIIRDQQKALNGAWRMLLDNGGLSSGPQIVVDRGKIQPANGKWELEPRKVWWRTAGDENAQNPAFDAFNVDGHMQEMLAVIETAMKFLDDESGIPLIAQGEQGVQQTQTLGGMSILMNSANVVFRRIVKNFDDDLTRPTIRRIYDWNMQFSDNEDIKGDMQVEARGSSVLLVKEMQAQNLMVVAIQLSTHPVFGPMIKQPGVLKMLFKTMMLPLGEVMFTDDELERMAKAAAAEPPPPDPAVQLEQEKLAAQKEITSIEAETRLEVARLNHEAAMQKAALDANTKLDKIEAELHKSREKIDSDERKFVAELGQTQETGPSGGGSF